MQQINSLSELDQLIDSLAATSPNIAFSMPIFVLSLVLVAACAYLLEKFFIRFGLSISNRRKLGRNFLLISLTTMLIITIVRSSLALSLGLVGALSIVRFRTAIKEAEELAFLFLAIALGLGFGAGQMVITLIAFVVILLIVFLRYWKHKKSNPNMLYVSISAKKPKNFSTKELVKRLQPYADQIDLNRRDEIDKKVEIGMYINFKDLSSMDDSFSEIKKYLRNASISTIDQSNLML